MLVAAYYDFVWGEMSALTLAATPVVSSVSVGPSCGRFWTIGCCPNGLDNQCVWREKSAVTYENTCPIGLPPGYLGLALGLLMRAREAVIVTSARNGLM